MSNLLTLLFAPTFLILIHYFDFRSVALIYIGFSSAFLIYAFIKKEKLEDCVIISIYLLLLIFSYFYNSVETVKFIPVFTAMTFAFIFTYSAIKNHTAIYKFTTRFYKKKLSEGEVVFLKKGDAFWAVAIFIYALFLLYLALNSDDKIWAFFSSLGWYIYFVLVLSLQILYGKVYAIKMPTK